MKRLLSCGIVTINKEGERVKLKSNMSKALFIMLFLFPFFVGGYYVFYTAAIGILLSALLLISIFKNKKINYSASFTFFVIAFMSVMTVFTYLMGFTAFGKNRFYDNNKYMFT